MERLHGLDVGRGGTAGKAYVKRTGIGRRNGPIHDGVPESGGVLGVLAGTRLA